jgi:NADPH-dependent 7-cyano-7-deazaguanine reductase QueF
MWTEETHRLELSDCCPISHNPQVGSSIAITYEPQAVILEVAALRAYLDSYAGGRGSVRSMEGMIQQVAQDCANALKVYVKVQADLRIEPGQEMHLACCAFPLVS